MKKDMIFFSPTNEGLTSTSANHIANLAKEMVRGLEVELDNIVLYSKSVALIGSAKAELLEKGSTEAELALVPDKLHKIARAKSLIAWLREGIKARDRMLKEIDELTLEAFLKNEGIEEPKVPKAGTPITEDDYYSSLSVDERNRYYSLETLAAVLGKAIHPDGCFADSRDDYMERMQNPREVTGDGRDTLIYSFEPSVPAEAVEDVYFKLQKQYREVQSSLNAIKFECQRAVKDSEVKESAEYARLLAAYNDEMSLLSARLSAHKKERSREIGNLRIVVPDSLREIFSEVSNLGKK